MASVEQALLKAIQIMQINLYSQYACVAWHSYDIAITLGQEVTLIWRAPWSAPKCLYLVVRYFGLFINTFQLVVNDSANLSDAFCHFWLRFNLFAGPVIFSSIVTVVFVLRLHALCGRNRKVLSLLVVLVSAEIAVELYVTAKTALVLQVSPRPFTAWLGCPAKYTGPTAGKLTFYAWAADMTVTMTFFSVTMVQCYKFIGSPKSVRAFREQSQANLSPLIRLFARDGAVFFAWVFAALLLCMLLDVYDWDNAYASLGVPWLIGTYSFTGSRIILNMRSTNASTAPGSAIANETELSWRPARRDRQGDTTMGTYIPPTLNEPQILSTVEEDVDL